MQLLLNQIVPCTDDYSFRFLTDLKSKDALVIHNPPNSLCESPVLIRSTKTLEEHIAYIAQEKINKAIIVAEEISFLRQCPCLEYVWIIPALTVDEMDYSPLYDLPNLQWLRCEMPHKSSQAAIPDCSRLRNLYYLSVSGWNANLNLSEVDRLKSLYLSDGCPTAKNLTVLHSGCSLENLAVQTSPITSLAGIKNARQLKRLELAYNKKLQNIDELAAVRETLIWLDIDHCNGISDFSVLSELHNLELLRLSGTNVIPSLDFIKNMPNLKCLVVRTNVLDGNLEQCINIPYVAIKNRKHFSHKDKDFSKSAPFPLSIHAYET